MPFLIISFVAGIALLQQRATLPPLLWSAALAPLVLLAWLVRRRQRILWPLLALTCRAAGFLWAAVRAEVRLNHALPPEVEGRDVQIVGVVSSLPQQYERSLRFEFDVERVLTTGANLPAHIALSWWGSAAKEGVPGSLPELKPGERWQLTVRLRQPRGNAILMDSIMKRGCSTVAYAPPGPCDPRAARGVSTPWFTSRGVGFRPIGSACVRAFCKRCQTNLTPAYWPPWRLATSAPSRPISGKPLPAPALTT